jgi:hypothetical protein
MKIVECKGTVRQSHTADEDLIVANKDNPGIEYDHIWFISPDRLNDAMDEIEFDEHYWCIIGEATERSETLKRMLPKEKVRMF